MRVSKRDDGAWSFDLNPKEKLLLREALAAYPVLDPAYQTLSKSASPEQLQASRELLREALAAQQEENRRMLRDMFGAARSPASSGRWQFTLDGRQVESLLQVLNDVRVGHWQALGCPDASAEARLEPTLPHLRSLLLMRLSGHFQTLLLEALEP
jgi:hypothetical protein